MRLEDMLKDISGITNQVVKTNCFEGQNTLLESILLLQTKMNEVIQAINDGIIKGDKGDKGDTGETGAKGDKGDTGKASESIQDNVVSLDTCYSSEKVESLFNDVKNIQGVKYATDKGYEVCKGTHNGVVKDLKIYGKSLVNLNQAKINAFCDIAIEPKKITHNTTTISYVANTVVGKEYTIVKYPSNRFVVGFAPNSEYMTNLSSFIQPTLDATQTEVVKVVATDVKMIVYVTNENKDTNVVILEGDHTQNPPSYFEGIASVGNDNGIEVLSRKEDGNLIDINKIDLTKYAGDIVTSKWYIKGDSICIDNITKDYESSAYYYIKVEKGLQHTLTVKNINCSVLIYNGIVSGHVSSSHITSLTISNKSASFNPNSDYITIRVSTEIFRGNIYVEELILNKGPLKNYESFKGDKKPILFKDEFGEWKRVTELRGIDLSLCDTIEKHSDGKHYLHVRTEKYVVTGNEVIDIPVVGTNTTQFRLIVPNILFNQLPICNMFNALPYQSIIDEECVMIGGSPNIHFKILKSKASTVEEFKQFVKNNRIELIVGINKEKIYEVNPIDLQSFENETMLSFNSYVIPPISEWYIDSNLGSIVLDGLARFKRLEDEVFKSNVAILRGDFRTLAEMYYPNDFIKEEELTNE